jgi:hypothetical protein
VCAFATTTRIAHPPPTRSGLSAPHFVNRTS